MEKTINYKKLSIHTLIIVTIILFAVISLQSGFAATTTTINNTDSGGISKALTDSAHGDIIELEEGTYTGNNNTNMTINKNITIQGKTKDKVILDAHGLSRIYTIGNNLNVTFINLTFLNGNTTANGGAIYNNYAGTIITFINCTFTNNTGNLGGAIYNVGNNISIDNSSFINNNAGVGASIRNSGNSINIINSHFENNSGTASTGGVWSNGNFTLVINSTFNNNTGISGGAININGGNNSSIINCTFTNNFATNNGGAMAIGGHNVSIINCTFTNNFATNNGGAISNGGSNTIVSNSNLNNNQANGNGGGIYNINSFNIALFNNTISNGTISNNGTVIMEGNIISNNLDQESILAISSSVSGRVVTVNVKATDIVGNVLVGATVDFYVDGVLVGTGITDSDGVVQFIYTATKVGTSDILVFMDEFSVIDVDDNEFIYSTVSNTTSVDVAKFNTNVTIVVSNATAGKQTIVRGVFVDDNGNPISGASLNVVIGGKSYGVVTGADGRWELPYIPSKVGNYNAKVYYNGDNLYLASTGSVAYTVAQEEFGIPQVPNIRLVKRNNSKAVRHGNVVYMKWLTFKNFGASGSQTINAKIIIKNLKYKLWKVYNKKLNYKFAKNNIKFKLNLKSNGVFKLKLKVYRPIK